MIDAEIDVFDEAARAVYALYPEAYVSAEHVEIPARFPAASIVETANSLVSGRLDSSGEEKMASLTYTADVYSNSQADAKRQCKRIIEAIDGRMRALNMARAFAMPVDNAADPSIYRMTARWTGRVDKHHVFYGR